MQPTREGEIYKLDNRVVEVCTVFHFVFIFFQLGYFFFIRQQIKDIRPFHWLGPATHESFTETGIYKSMKKI